MPLRRALRDALLGVAVFANATWWWPLLRDPRRAMPLDWTAFYRGSGAVLTGRLASEYSQSVHGAHLMPLLYPPPLFVLLAPLGLGSAWVAYRALQLATLAAFAVTIGLLRRTLADRAAIFAALCLCSAPWVLDVQLGQLGMLWVLGFVVAMRALERERGFTAGLALSLFALKPTLGAFVAFALLVRADRRALAGFACGVAALIAASLPLGPDVWRAYRDASIAMAHLVDSGGVDNWRQQTMRVAVRAASGPRALSRHLCGDGAPRAAATGSLDSQGAGPVAGTSSGWGSRRSRPRFSRRICTSTTPCCSSSPRHTGWRIRRNTLAARAS